MPVIELAAKIAQVGNPAQRAVFLRDLAGLKAEAAPLIRDDLDLQGYRAETPHADYRGLPVPDGDARAAAIRAEADRDVAGLVERFGLRPDATLARFAREAMSVGLGRDYRAEEMAERAADRAGRGQPAERVDAAEAQLALFHRQAGAIYRAAAERLRELEREDPRGQASDVDRSAGATTRAEEPSAERADAHRPSARRRDRDDNRSR